jgi:heme/copper-type cytochrome/quinol oxidase subunit 2
MTEQDSIVYDSVAGRPLPGWLQRQKQGLNTYTPEKRVMKEDRSIETSIILTGVFIIIVVTFLTIYFLRKKK